MNRKVLSLSLIRFSDLLGGGMAYFTVPILLGALNLHNLPLDFASGIAISMWGLFATIFQPLSGKIIDRIGHPKKFLISSLLLTSLLIFLYTRVSTLSELILLRAFLGIVESSLIVSSLTMLMHFSGKKKGSSVGIYNTFTDLGFSISPLLAGFLIIYGIDVVFYVAALFTLLASLLAYSILDDVESVRMREKSGSFRDLSREMYPVLISLIFAVSMVSSIIPLENSFIRRLEVTPLEFGLSFTLYLVTRTVSNPYAGRLADRMGGERLYIISILLLSLTSPILLTTSFSIFLLVRTIQGIIVAFVYTSSAIYMAERSGLSYALSMSILSSAITASLTAGPVLSGFISGFLGFEIVYVFFSLAIAMSSLYLCIRKGK